MRLTYRHLALLAGVSVAVVGLKTSAPSRLGPRPPHAVPASPLRGISNLMDYGATGSKLVAPEVYGLGTSMANLALTQFPPEVAPVTGQVFLVEGSGPQTFTATPAGARRAASSRPAAPGPPRWRRSANRPDAVLEATAAGTRAGATALHPVLQPFDLTAGQFADYLDSLRQK